jgi:RIO kinase 1
VDARTNPHALPLLQRDITRVCDYFGRFHIQSDPVELAQEMWREYMRGE